MFNLGLVIACCVIGYAQGWDNNYDETFTFECADNQVIYRVRSQHDNKKEDRQFEFFCKDFNLGFSKCSWTGFVNDFDACFFASCPGNGLINGVYSYHDNGKEDRRWRFRCCDNTSYYTVNCHSTPPINDYDDFHEYQAPSGYFIQGVSATHSNDKEDRRWQYNVCQILTGF